MTSLICTRARRSLPMHREEPHRRVSTIYLFCTRQACDYGTVLARERGLSWPKHQQCPTLLFLLEYPLGLSLMSCGEALTSAMRSPSAFTRRQKLWDTELIHQPKHFAWVTRVFSESFFWAHAGREKMLPVLFIFPLHSLVVCESARIDNNLDPELRMHDRDAREDYVPSTLSRLSTRSAPSLPVVGVYLDEDYLQMTHDKDARASLMWGPLEVGQDCSKFRCLTRGIIDQCARDLAAARSRV